MRKISINLFVVCIMLTAYGYTSSSDESEKKIQPLKEEQTVYYHNPLKGFSTFVFTTQFPATKKIVDKVNIVVKDVLSSFGKVVPLTLLVQTEEGEGFDLSGFGAGAFLTYEITDLTSLEGKKLGLLKGTLTLQAIVKVAKTNVECMPYIWSQSCFFKGSTDKKLEASISSSLKSLLQSFLNEYMLVNTEKPIFNLYQP